MTETPTHLRLEGITKKYGQKVAVDRLDLAVPAGELWGLIGPNGAGKTSALLVTAGQSPPDGGRALMAGHDVWDDPIAARGVMGYVPQEPELYRYLTVAEMLEFVGDAKGVDPKLRNEQVDEMLALWELEDARHRLCGQLSVGMAKKVAITAALLGDPKVVILDEPFAGLDPRAVIRLKERLREQCRRGASVLLAEHVLDVIENLCDAVAILVAGRLRRVLTADEIRDLPEDGGLEQVFLRTIEPEALAD